MQTEVNEKPLYCKKYSKVAYASSGPKSAVFTRLRCKSWQCDYCAAKNASIWRAHLKEKLPTVSDTWYLVTLTAHPTKRSRVESLTNIREHIDALIKRIRRVFGSDIEYIRVYEKHPTSNALHAHMIMSGLTDYVARGFSVKHRPMAIGVINRDARYGVWAVKSWFKVVCHELGMGHMVDVQKIKDNVLSALLYVCAYLTKEQQNFHIPYLKHVQVTKGIGSPEVKESFGWHVSMAIEARMFEPNCQITDLNTNVIIDNNWWERHSYYPIED